MQRALGIDLGTTNSVMAVVMAGEPQIVKGRDDQDLMPSLVGLAAAGALLVGNEARTQVGAGGDVPIVSIKRFMGRKFNDPEVQHALQRMPYPLISGPDGDVRVRMGEFEYTPVEISALILRRLKEDAEQRLGEQFTRAVITVPAYFGERQVAATREAGRMAGFRVMRIINEPTAAALAYGLDRGATLDGSTILVYDLGGGTFDISILLLTQGAFTVLGAEGDNLLGGDDFDRDLFESLLESARQEYGVDLSADGAAMQALRVAVEPAKIALSAGESAEVRLTDVQGRDELRFGLGRSAFEKLIGQRVERTIELTHKALAEATLTIDSVDAVLLVGGSTAIPLIRQQLADLFGAEKVRTDVNPMQCVALGAAIQTALLTEIECLACQRDNPIERDTCLGCGAPLYGMVRISCPRCHTLVEAGRKTCRKCRAALPQLAAEVAPTAGVQPEAAGLRCEKCGATNAPGVEQCAQCGAPVGTFLVDITPKPLGVELEDGRLAVMIAKGTVYPTLEPESKDFYTTVFNQRRLEIAVFEGASPMARQNELCGIVTLSLPPGLARSTPVNVSFGLDRDRTLLITVRVRELGGEARQVSLRRGQLDPERQRLIVAQREQVTQFLDRWDREVRDSERKLLHDILDELDEALSEDPAEAETPLEMRLANAKQAVEFVAGIRGTAALLSNLHYAFGSSVPAEERLILDDVADKLEIARADGDWTRAGEWAHAADVLLARFGEPTRRMAFARIFVAQKKLTPALASRASTVLHTYDSALAAGNTAAAQQPLDEMTVLWAEIEADLMRNDNDPAAGAGITDRSSQG